MTALDVASVYEQPDVFATLQLMSPLTTDSTDDIEVIVKTIAYTHHDQYTCIQCDFLYSTLIFWKLLLMK